jgi:hypothetical protein
MNYISREEISMKKQFDRVLLGVAMLAVWVGITVIPASAGGILYQQPWDGGSNLFASQNDTTGGFGNFATTYDNFTLGSNSNVNGVGWTGGYFNPPNQGPITAWTLTFYNDNAGIPGAPIATGSFGGTGNETFLANVNGFPIYTYSLSFANYNVGPGTYWLSVVPDLGYPPQWGWATGIGPNQAYQCFFGTCGATGTSMAFDINGSVATPEPSSVLMLATALAALSLIVHKKLV